MPKRPPRVVFDTDYMRITPQTHQELLALEPVEIGRLVQTIGQTEQLRSQIVSKGYRNCIKKLASLDLSQPLYLPDGLLDGCMRLLTWLQKQENLHANTVLFKQEQERQQVKKHLRRLNGTPAFNRFLSRRQVVEDLASRGKTPVEMLELNTAELATLLEANRWCATYTSLQQNPLLAEYCKQHGLDSNLLDQLSYLQLKEIADTIDTSETENTDRQTLIDKICTTYPNWQDLIRNHPRYQQAQHGPLSGLAIEQLSALVLELEALNDFAQNGGIGFDAEGNLISRQ